YANTMHVGMLDKHLESKPHVVGQRYMYIENLNMPRPHGQPIGHINPLTGDKKWRRRRWHVSGLPRPRSSAASHGLGINCLSTIVRQVSAHFNRAAKLRCDFDRRRL